MKEMYIKMKDSEKADNSIRIVSRAFARELTEDELRVVSGAGCGGTDTVQTGGGSDKPDRTTDCGY